MTDLQPQIDAALDRVDAKLAKLDADTKAAAEASRWLIERLEARLRDVTAERDRLVRRDGVLCGLLQQALEIHGHGYSPEWTERVKTILRNAALTASGELLADYRDVLECGHTVTHEMGRHASKRRCYVCGAEGK